MRKLDSIFARFNIATLAGKAFHRKWRFGLDRFARRAVGFGGVGVIIAILLIFFYLAYVVVPLFIPASVEKISSYTLPSNVNKRTLHLAMEEQTEVGMRVSDDAHVVFFQTVDGQVLSSQQIKLPARTRVTAFANADPAMGLMAFGLSDGRAIIFKHKYKVTFPDNKRLITPELEFPMGEMPLVLDNKRKAIQHLTVQQTEEAISLALITADQRLLLVNYSKQESLLDDEAKLERQVTVLPPPVKAITHLMMDKDQRELYTINEDGNLSFYDILDKSQPEMVQRVKVVAEGDKVSSLTFLSGGISILIGTEGGKLTQWFPARKENGDVYLAQVRSFQTGQASLTSLTPEYNRKGFLAADDKGQLGIYHATAHNKIITEKISEQAVSYMAVAPRANAMLVQSADSKIHFWRIHNEHPEISMSSLWGKVWYESHDEPKYLWQSSSASNDFEPKFSLVPISFGTLKAAFYAMLIAVPLSIMGAIFTAQFMTSRMRKVVKPSIEIMEALPTVILGFLAGLWLAPFIEYQLPGIFILLIILPPGIFLAGYVWSRLPDSVKHKVPEGWEAALLLPVILILGAVAFSISPVIESAWFGGDVRVWMNQELGISFDQRNSIVVGLAMGFAVIPTIFSIAEDALFAVPKHLVQGSLALGATPWQTLMRVVILTASPGIFSAVMIGMGRAVGETMIVLMATGNTPVMDLSIFQGMRTLSANVAVEMPESEVDSTHYRVLFLAALLLFAFTFIFNTLAELVRQRLRRKYSSM